MNIKSLIAFVVLIAIGIFGYSYYSSKKHEERLAIMQAESAKVQAETARLEAEQKETERSRAFAEAEKAISENRAAKQVAESKKIELEAKSEIDKQAKEKLLNSAKRFGDLGSLAFNTPRIALGPIIRDMQNLKREVEAIQTGECTESAKKYLMESIDVTVYNFSEFFGDADFKLRGNAMTESLEKYSKAIDLCK